MEIEDFSCVSDSDVDEGESTSPLLKGVTKGPNVLVENKGKVKDIHLLKWEIKLILESNPKATRIKESEKLQLKKLGISPLKTNKSAGVAEERDFILLLTKRKDWSSVTRGWADLKKVSNFLTNRLTPTSDGEDLLYLSRTKSRRIPSGKIMGELFASLKQQDN